jgi:hypothetical protein
MPQIRCESVRSCASDRGACATARSLRAGMGSDLRHAKAQKTTRNHLPSGRGRRGSNAAQNIESPLKITSPRDLLRAPAGSCPDLGGAPTNQGVGTIALAEDRGDADV